MLEKCLSENPAALWEAKFCLDSVSKDGEGKLAIKDKQEQKCEDGCVTLRVRHVLEAKLTAHDCDSERSKKFLNGTFMVRLTSAFLTNGGNRGLHAGEFSWMGAGVVIRGTLSGVTNLGTHRAPAFQPACQKCGDRGVMEGQLCGQVVEAKDPSMMGCEVKAAYRIRFQPTKAGGQGGVRLVIEGMLVCPCK